MFTAAVRVLARAAAIQLEEAAARSARAGPSTQLGKSSPGPANQPLHVSVRSKGKERANVQEVDRYGSAEVQRPSAPSSVLDEVRRTAGSAPTSPIVTDEQTRSPSVELREPGPSVQPRTSDKAPIDHHADTNVPFRAAEPIASADRVDPASSGRGADLDAASEKNSETVEPHSTNSPFVEAVATNDPPPSAAHEAFRPLPPQTTSAAIPPIEPAKSTEAAGPSLAGTRDMITEDPTSASSSNIDLTQEDEPGPILRASKVPSSRLGRLFHYGSLAASLSLGAAGESIRRSTGSGGKEGSVFMSDANVRRLVGALGRMRGAALKLGQFMSIQDNNLLPPEIEKVLHQVQAHADYMPDWQLEQVMSSELGSNWQSLFTDFSRVPIASASIGQVHKATLASTGLPVAVKVQFPGIASSISSDLSNLSILLRGSAVLPRGLYLQNTIAVMRRELADECDYVREAESGRRFGRELEKDEFFVVPKVVDEATTERVLTTEWMSGKPLSRIRGMSQAVRDRIGTNILRLCLIELFQFRFMQTDPNWANFLYDAPADKVQLIDFGASREYTREFMDGWFRLLSAALSGDRHSMKVESERLGYLTGDEGDEMVQAHLDSMALVASPFSYEGKYAFANQTITDSVRALIPIMLKQRLTPPPPETYSLNRKLSGAFLMCARLGANVDCKKLWQDHAASYQTVEMEQGGSGAPSPTEAQRQTANA